ncbi:MAG: hypothetical protein P4L64_17995 [Caulobacteraceae bacterium]|nr:hypothetical protein [Caulobacteraceae bacterium]
MSCDVALAAYLMFAAFNPATDPGARPTLIAAPATAPATAPAGGVAQEPLFKDIVARASGLKAEVEAYRGQIKGAAAPIDLAGFDIFKARIGELSALDQQGHELLKARGTDGDLKCILHGISQDLPLKLAAVTAAKTGHDQDLALRDMAYLLNDNVEVITAPPAPPV